MLIVGAVLLSAAGGVAQAADQRGKAMDFTVRPDVSAIAQSRSLKWDAGKGRWGVTLNLEQTDTRESTWNDASAGAYYRVTPSLRVGGAVSVGDQPLANVPKKLNPNEGQPRVRLETAFKF